MSRRIRISFLIGILVLLLVIFWGGITSPPEALAQGSASCDGCSCSCSLSGCLCNCGTSDAGCFCSCTKDKGLLLD